MVKAKTANADCVNAANPYHRCADFCFKRPDVAPMAKGIKDSGYPVLYIFDNRTATKENVLHNDAKERSVYPQCVNASNPYHVCAKQCFEKFDQIKVQVLKNQKSDESAVLKVTTQERKVHPDCPNASNPYHVCAAYCFDKMENAAVQMNKKDPDPSFMESFKKSSRKKKKGAKSQDEHPQGHPAVIKVPSADAPPPSSLSSPNKKVELANIVPISSQQYSEETPQNHCSDEKQVQSFQSLLSAENSIKPNGLKDDPVIPVEENAKCITNVKSTKEEDEQEENIITPPIGSMSSNISDVTFAFEDSDNEEAYSMISDSKVQVGKYYVKEINSSTLQSIFDQRGDIAAGSSLESALIRSYYLDCVCSVVRELQSTPFMLLSKSRAKELSTILSDIESSQINVGWLRERLNEITEAMELISNHRSIKAAKVKCDQSLESTRKELECQMENLAQKEKEVADVKARVLDLKNRLSELEAESSQLNESYSSIMSKVEKINIKPLSDAVI